MTIPDDLADIRNQLYEKAECFWTIAFWLPLCTQAATLVAFLVDYTPAATVITIVAVSVPIAVYWIRDYASSIVARADKCRRMILYADGLGNEISPAELALVRSWGIGEKLKEATFVAPYYASRLARGPNRLADIATESAFFTSYLTEKVIMRMKIVFAVSTVLLIGVLYAASVMITQTQAAVGMVSWITKTASSVIAVLICGDFALLHKRYNDLKSAADNAVDRCARLRSDSAVSVDRVIQAVEDYNLALAKGPQVPRRMYEKYKEQLNQAYRTSHGLVSGGSK